MQTKYLVTGAAGNLGSNIIQKLLAAGESVRALVLNGDPAEKLLPQQTEIVRGDVLDLQSFDRFFAVDKNTRVIVIHAASIVALRPEFSQKVYDVNVIGTQNIVAKCVENKVAKLVYISSTGAIPELPKGQSIKEVSCLDARQVRGCYAQTKAQATAYVFEEGKKQGLNVSVIYPSGILGPNDYSYGLFSKFAISYASGKLPIGVKGSFNAVDVRDLADCVIACAHKGRAGEGCIIANKTVTFEKMVSLYQRYCNGKKCGCSLHYG